MLLRARRSKPQILRKLEREHCLGRNLLLPSLIHLRSGAFGTADERTDCSSSFAASRSRAKDSTNGSTATHVLGCTRIGAQDSPALRRRRRARNEVLAAIHRHRAEVKNGVFILACGTGTSVAGVPCDTRSTIRRRSYGEGGTYGEKNRPNCVDKNLVTAPAWAARPAW